MPYITVDIDLDDVYDELRDHEKQLLVDWLKQDGYTEYGKPASALQQLFEEDLEKIRKAYLTISKEDFEAINRIAKKY
jgi:hypothetical protein